MKIYQTEIMKAAKRYPTLYEYERILYHRKNKFDSNRYYFENLEKGEFGEQEVIRLLKQYGLDHWVIVRNIWLNQNGRFECDILLFTSHCLYVFEVKNFEGLFEYIDGDCYLNGKLLANNCIFQAQKAFRNMTRIIQRLPFSINMKGALIFIGEFNPIDIQSKVNDISTVARSDFKEYIQKIVTDESTHLIQLDIDSVMHHLEKYEITNPFIPEPIHPEIMQGLRKGIYCAYCQSFALTIQKHTVHCQKCEADENRDDAMVRTVDEYSLLNYNKPLFQNDIMTFINQQASKNYLISILKMHFGLINKNRYSYYTNHYNWQE